MSQRTLSILLTLERELLTPGGLNNSSASILMGTYICHIIPTPLFQVLQPWVVHKLEEVPGVLHDEWAYLQSCMEAPDRSSDQVSAPQKHFTSPNCH